MAARQIKRSRALIRLCDMLYGEGKIMEPDNAMEKACNLIQSLLNKIDALQKEKAKMFDSRGKSILGVSDKSFNAAILPDALPSPKPEATKTSEFSRLLNVIDNLASKEKPESFESLVDKHFGEALKAVAVVEGIKNINDITEAVTVLSRLIYDPASEIDPDLRMESYRVLHKHKMLQPLAFAQPQPKVRE